MSATAAMHMTQDPGRTILFPNHHMFDNYSRKYHHHGKILHDMFDDKFEQAFVKDDTYLMGLDGVEVLMLQDFEGISFLDPMKVHWVFHMEY